MRSRERLRERARAGGAASAISLDWLGNQSKLPVPVLLFLLLLVRNPGEADDRWGALSLALGPGLRRGIGRGRAVRRCRPGAFERWYAARQREGVRCRLRGLRQDCAGRADLRRRRRSGRRRVRCRQRGLGPREAVGPVRRSRAPAPRTLSACTRPHSRMPPLGGCRSRPVAAPARSSSRTFTPPTAPTSPSPSHASVAPSPPPRPPRGRPLGGLLGGAVRRGPSSGRPLARRGGVGPW